MQLVVQTSALWDAAIESAKKANLDESIRQAVDQVCDTLRQQRDQLNGLTAQMNDLMHSGNVMALKIQNTLANPPAAPVVPDIAAMPVMPEMVADEAPADGQVQEVPVG